MRPLSRLRYLPGILLLALFTVSCLGPSAGNGGTTNDGGLVRYTETVGGAVRSYWIYHPESPPGGPMPLVMMFHGSNGSGPGMSQALRFNEIAGEHGFIVAYPTADVGNWAEGCGCNNADRLQVKDMEFVEQMIRRIKQEYRLDEERIYGVGFSQGGLFAGRLGCEASDRFRGIVVVAANMSVPLSARCAPERPVAIKIIQGTADEVLPYGGTDNGALSLLSAPETARLWAGLNGVAEYEEISWRPDEERGWVKINRYESPDGDPRRYVELLSVYMTGHTWIRNPWVNSEEEILDMVLNR